MASWRNQAQLSIHDEPGSRRLSDSAVHGRKLLASTFHRALCTFLLSVVLVAHAARGRQTRRDSRN